MTIKINNDLSLVIQTIVYTGLLYLATLWYSPTMADMIAVKQLLILVLITVIISNVVFLIVKQTPSMKFMIRGADGKTNESERKTAVHLYMIIFFSISVLIGLTSPQIMINSNEGSVNINVNELLRENDSLKIENASNWITPEERMENIRYLEKISKIEVVE